MKNLLVVVDYQVDFVQGSLGNENALKIYPNILDVVNKFKENNDDIIFTKDTHENNYLNTIEGKNLPIIHCLKNSEGHKLYKDLENISKSYTVINKKTFPSIDLINVLKNKEYEEIYVCGVVTNICVISNAIILKAIYPNTNINIIKSCCASNDLELESKSFDIMKNLHFNII